VTLKIAARVLQDQQNALLEGREPKHNMSERMLRGCVSTGRKEPQVSPLRYAPVGMTILLGVSISG
jgi:hypothetical protein